MSGHSLRDHFEAVVTNTADPEKRGRIKVTSRALVEEGAELPDWLEPQFPYTSDGAAGWFFLPAPGTVVEVEAVVAATSDDSPGMAFVSAPEYRWRCSFYPTPADIPPEFLADYGNRFGVKTPSGLLLMFDETLGQLVLGGLVRLGSELATDPMVLGSVLMLFLVGLVDALAAHTHVDSAGGPTLPPANAAAFATLKATYLTTGAMLSTKVFGEK